MLTPTQDPFAAIAQPARPSSPPPAAPAQDPFAAIAQPAGATPPAAPSSSSSGGIGAFADKYFGGSPEEQEAGWGNPVAAGMIKSAGSGLGGLIDLVRPQVGSDPESVRGRVAGHMKDAA